MKRILSASLFCVLFAGAVYAQKDKPWTEWSKKDAEKTLNDSAWAQTQVEGESMPSDTSAVTQVSAPRAATRALSNNEGQSGQSAPSKMIKYRMRFLSAKPIRQGFARMVLLSQQTPNENLASQLQAFVDRDFSEYIVVAVTIEAADQKLVEPVQQAFLNATAETLKENTFLERKDGKRLPLMDYRAPSGDGMGAKFVFQRMLDGHPFLTAESDNVRFVSELNKKIKLNSRYRLSEMTYDGKLEY